MIFLRLLAIVRLTVISALFRPDERALSAIGPVCPALALMITWHNPL